jgi:hypothetical protein
LKGWRRSAVTVTAPLTILAMAAASAPAAASTNAPAATAATNVHGARPAPAAAIANARNVAGVSSLALSAAVQERLLRLYVASRHIRVSDIAEVLPGSARAAHITASGKDWASVSFRPSAHAPASVAIGFQDGGGRDLCSFAARQVEAGRPWRRAVWTMVSERCLISGRVR